MLAVHNRAMNLRRYLARKGATQAELADKLGINQSTLSRWLTRGVPPMRVRAVAKATGLTPAQLRPDLWGRE